MVEHWDALHTQPRFLPRYPNEHVACFAMRSFGAGERSATRMLDIGMGGGRHTKLFCELGFQVTGTDISAQGLIQARSLLSASHYNAQLLEASMFDLPFPDEHFQGAISFGVYYYADEEGMKQAIRELHRVLAPSGAALILVRTDRDYRFGKGEALGRNTFRLNIQDTNELDLIMHFVSEEEIPHLFSAFSGVEYERAETTFNGFQKLNSDWLITVQK